MAAMEMKKHVVVFPFTMHGHLIPFLMLAHRLDAIGFQVSYVCPEYRIQHVKNQARARGCNEGSIQFMILKGNSHLLSTSGRQHDSFDDTLSLVERSQDLRNDFQKLVEELIASDAPPCCIIADNLFSWAQDVANELKLPRLVMYPSPAQALAVIFHLKQLLEQGKYPINTSGEDIQIPGIPSPLHPMDCSTPSWDTSPKLLQDFYIRNALRIHESAGIICNTFEALEPDLCNAFVSNRELNPRLVPFLPAGPLLPHRYFSDHPLPETSSTEDDEEVLLWLNKQPAHSVLFISFGSIAKASREQIEVVAGGVKASGYRFLWSLPANGKDKFLVDELISRVGNRGIVIEGWINQLLVLSHSATGGFLSHAGWNSTMESISQGVPMVMLPMFAEQRGNARYIEDTLKAGIWLSRYESFDGMDVEAAVCKVMQDKCIRENSIQLQYAARKAAASSDENMVAFITRCIAQYES